MGGCRRPYSTAGDGHGEAGKGLGTGGDQLASHRIPQSGHVLNVSVDPLLTGEARFSTPASLRVSLRRAGRGPGSPTSSRGPGVRKRGSFPGDVFGNSQSSCQNGGGAGGKAEASSRVHRARGSVCPTSPSYFSCPARFCTLRQAWRRSGPQ